MSTDTHGRSSVPKNVAELEEVLSRPPVRLIEACEHLEGDLVFLGVGGKMGPTMARMARRAFDQAGLSNRVIGVSRFRTSGLRQRLEEWGIETVVGDLLDERQVERLPDASMVVAMSGFKFGASTRPDLAWATNCYMPALICQRYSDSRIVAFSTGNVYGLVPRSSGGSVESDPPRPDGEYAMTALGRERMYEYFSHQNQIPVALLRLNYATELRYGVLVDLARQVADRQPIDLSMSYVNVIWLGDANAMTLQAVTHAASPVRIINLAGPDILSVREVCLQLGHKFDVAPQFVGRETEGALLNNGARGHELLGHPLMPVDQVLDWTAQWIKQGGPLLDKPTHFQNRSGQF